MLRVPHSQQGRGTSSRQLGHWSGSFEGGRVSEVVMDKEVDKEMDKEVDKEVDNEE